MNKNVIELVVDSLGYRQLITNKDYQQFFLKKLADKGYSCTNIYSQAPFTEAAVMSLQCGQRVLDYGGYLKRLDNSSKTIFDLFNEQGFDIYQTDVEPHYSVDSQTRNINNYFLNVFPDSNALVTYRLNYYFDLFDSGSINEQDYSYLLYLLEDYLRNYHSILNEIVSGKLEHSSFILKDVKDVDFNRMLLLVDSELNEYKKDPNNYVVQLLKLKKEHSLLQIPNIFLDNKLKENRNEIQEILTPTIKRVHKVNRRHNLLHNHINFKDPFRLFFRYVKSLSKSDFKQFLKSIYTNIDGFIKINNKSRYKEPIDRYKNAPSFVSNYKHFLNWYDNKKNEKPFYSYIHCCDIRNPEIYYTYDSNNISEIKEDCKRINKFLDELPSKYHGNVGYDLALKYIDSKIEDFFTELQKRNLLENSLIIITADHGFSFSSNPIRENYIATNYLENYQVPFIIFNGSKKGIDNESRTTYDIPATIAREMNIKLPDNFFGHSVFEKSTNESPYHFIEYIRSGCPDIKRRKLSIAIFDNEYLLSINMPLSANFSDKMIEEIYDLKKDPLQKKNIRKSALDLPHVIILKGLLEKRFLEIKRNENV